MAWLTGWAADQRLEATIDFTKIPATLLDFPVLLKISDSAGINQADITDFFDKLAVAVTGDDFTGTSGPPDPNLWTAYYTSFGYAPRLSSNQMLMETWLIGGTSGVKSKFLLNGDIELQIDFIKGAGGASGDLIAIEIRIDEDNFIQANWTYGTNHYWGVSVIGGSTTSNSTTTSDTTGKLRVRRVGTTWYADYWNGSGWTNIHSASSCPSADLYTWISLEGSGDFIGYADNFVVTDGDTIWPAGADPNKLKIAVTAADGTTEQKVEIDRWDAANELVWLHTKAPSISPTVDTLLYVYYDADHADNTANVGPTLSLPARAVWNSDFVCVYHLGQIPAGSSSVKDSTGNLLHATPGGSMTEADLVDGKVGQALDFDGDDDMINMGSDTKLDNIVVTAEAIINPTTWGKADIGHIIAKFVSDGSVDGWRFHIQKDPVQEPPTFTEGLIFFVNTSPSPGIFQATDCISLATWQHVAVTFDPEPDAYHWPNVYVEGVEIPLEMRFSYTGWQNDERANFTIGGEGYSNYTFDGLIDEVRVSDIIRPAAWIKATRETLFDNLINWDGPGVGEGGGGQASVISNEVIHSGLFGGQLVR